MTTNNQTVSAAAISALSQMGREHEIALSLLECVGSEGARAHLTAGSVAYRACQWLVGKGLVSGRLELTEAGRMALAIVRSQGERATPASKGGRKAKLVM
jgi:hypothetical protein